MKSVEDLITELNYSLPYGDNEIRKAYKLGQINLLLELSSILQGYPVNGLIRGIITEEQLTDKLVEVSND